MAVRDMRRRDMRRFTTGAGSVLLGAAALACALPADEALAGRVVLRATAGEQDFADGTTPMWSWDAREAGAGEAFPFDGTVFGSDISAALGSFEYAHEFDPAALAGQQELSATLTFGLIDHDSPPTADGSPAADTIDFFLDGLQQADEPFRGVSRYDPMTPSSVSVLSVAVPADLLADGRLEVRFVATRAGPGNFFSGNSIHPDFSTLTVLASDVAPGSGPNPGPGPGTGGPGSGPGATPVPLPPAGWAALVLLAGVGAAGWAKRSRRVASAR